MTLRSEESAGDTASQGRRWTVELFRQLSNSRSSKPERNSEPLHFRWEYTLVTYRLKSKTKAGAGQFSVARLC